MRIETDYFVLTRTRKRDFPTQTKDFLKRHSLVIGIALMFLYTWTIDLSNSGVLPFQFPFAVYITLGWGFIFASLLMTGLTLGKGAVIALLKRYLTCNGALRGSGTRRRFSSSPSLLPRASISMPH